MNENWETVFGLLFAIAIVFCLVWLLNWVVEDAEKRGKNSFVVFLAVFLFFPWGLIAWLVFRPEEKPRRRPSARRYRNRDFASAQVRPRLPRS